MGVFPINVLLEAMLVLGAGTLLIKGMPGIITAETNKQLARASCYVFLATFIALFVVIGPRERLFSPADSFTIGSIALLIVTERLKYEKTEKNTDKILLSRLGIPIITFFVAGFIGTVLIIVYPTSNGSYAGEISTIKIFLEYLENSLFLVGSVSIVSAVAYFIAPTFRQQPSGH